MIRDTIRTSTMPSLKIKKERGQFYSVNASYILQDLDVCVQGAKCIVEPFGGHGDLLEWASKAVGRSRLNVYAYDIDPKKHCIVQRDTLMDPPDYEDAWVITNPPYLARNKSHDKRIFDKYNTNDLYKCFLKSLVNGHCHGGILILPVGFFLSPRPLDVECRDAFLSRYEISRINYFEESVFPDTSTTVVAFSFRRAPRHLTSQDIVWVRFPSKERCVFHVESKYDWIVGGELYKMPMRGSRACRVERFVMGKPLDDGVFLTHLTLNALDSGKDAGRISLRYKKGFVYQGRESSRTYATICVRGTTLTEAQQQTVADAFNEWIEKMRVQTWSLFLPQYRESKEYARKRIPFDLAYRMIERLMDERLS